MKLTQIFCIITISLIFGNGCSILTKPVVEKEDDGRILGTLVTNKKKYDQGEPVEVTFTIENISKEIIILEHNEAPVQDLLVVSSDVERLWSEQSGKKLNRIELEPGEIVSIEWTLKDLETGLYSVIGKWWSAGIREVEVVARIEYGSARY